MRQLRQSFEYALIRVVPRVERGECLNAGVVLFCRPRRFLAARVSHDRARLLALAPDLAPDELDAIDRQLALIPRLAAGDAAGGQIARLPLHERWHWLVAPASTVIQPSPVHTGLCDDPAAELDDLFATMVLPPAPFPLPAEEDII
ncbi:MAG: DUF3037 domain-containing protein [Thermomicrobiales bacterium]